MQQRHGMMMLVAVLVAGWIGQAQALDRHVGERCWTLEPFADTIVLDIVQHAVHADGQQWFFSYTMQWRGVIGDTIFYLLPGGGTATYGFNSIAHDIFSLQATLHNASTFFRSNPVCSFHTVVAGVDLEGPWQLTCRGNLFDQFMSSGTMIPTACVPLPGEAGSDLRMGIQGSHDLAGD